MKRKRSLDDVFRPRRSSELSAKEAQKFHAALDLIQRHISEFRELGYDGPDLQSYDPRTDSIIDIERHWRCIFSFPILIRGGLAGSAQFVGGSIYLTTNLWERQSVERIAFVVAHELLHLCIEMFHGPEECGNPTNDIDLALVRILNVDLEHYLET